MSKQLNFASEYKVANWLQSHHDEVKSKTANEVLPDIKADTGVDLKRNQVIRIAREAGMNLFTREVRSTKRFNPSCQYDSMAILAKSINEIASSLDIKLHPAEKLKLIFARRLSQVSEQLNGEASPE
jgi:hypothetical protein